MKNYNRIMLGKAGCYADECYKGNYIGANFDIIEDLTGNLPDNWRTFNEKYVPVFLKNHPEKSSVTAGLACGNLYAICKGLKLGDIVLCPNGKGVYLVGEIAGDYYYAPGTDLIHRRQVKWYKKTIMRSAMSESLRHSTGSIGTCCDVTKYASEIESLLDSSSSPDIVTESIKAVGKPYEERSLHKLFCTTLRQRDIFAKTIFHEQSSKKSDQAQKWVHPDIVGVQFLDFRKECTKSLMKATEPKETIRLYSYEIKKSIASDYELKQYYFQALSNSSWAHYGYLVAYDIEDGLMDEMERLNGAFGIGIIKMQAHDSDTEILFPAKENELDYRTIDKLCSINVGFEEFITKLSKVVAAEKEYASDAKAGFEKICDVVFADGNNEEIESYCKEKGIPY